jgi:spore coat protein U-like protein
MRVPLIVALMLAAAPPPSCLAQSVAGLVQCQLAASSLAFGRYPPGAAAPTDSTAMLTVTCTTASASPLTVHATIALAATAPVRQVRVRSHALRYQLYVDAARTVPWGDGNAGTAILAATGLVSRGSPFRQQVTVYGRLLARQKDAAVGSYTDQISSILTY